MALWQQSVTTLCTAGGGRAGGEKCLYGFVEGDHLGNIGIEGKLVLKYTLENNDGRTWIGLIWLRVGTRDRLLCTR